jgi:integrase
MLRGLCYSRALISFAAYRDERLQAIKPSSLKRSLVPTHNLFEVAREEWDLPLLDNPLKRLRLAYADRRRERRLAPGEFERLLEAAQRSRISYLIPVLRLALETAMRRGDLLGIKADHVDLQNRSLLIPDSKNGQPRQIPLSVEAVQVLRPIIGGSGRLFPVTANAFRLAWERTTRRAGISDLHFHDLRHEAISRLFEKGLSVPEVALISGHREVRMLFRYTHPIRTVIIAKLDSTAERTAEPHGDQTKEN